MPQGQRYSWAARRTRRRRYVVEPWPPRAGEPDRWNVESHIWRPTTKTVVLVDLVTRRAHGWRCSCADFDGETCAHIAAVLTVARRGAA